MTVMESLGYDSPDRHFFLLFFSSSFLFLSFIFTPCRLSGWSYWAISSQIHRVSSTAPFWAEMFWVFRLGRKVAAEGTGFFDWAEKLAFIVPNLSCRN
jgi:hypothetical protein